MGLSFNPASLIMKWMDSKRDSQLRIADYLDEIAQEAENIATIWQETIQAIKINNSVNVFDIDNAKDLIVMHGGVGGKHSNAMPYSRLRNFYQNVSRVLGEDNQSEIDPIVFRIGAILENRNLTKKLVEKQLSEISGAEFFNGQSNIESMTSLDGSIETLHMEAAALRVFSSSFRAKIK